MARVGFIGLGVMGAPIAAHLAQKGKHQLSVYNRTHAKAQTWVARYGGTCATTPREAARDAESLLLCVGNDEDVRSVLYGEAGALAALPSGALLVDHTTTSAALARETATRARQRGLAVLDAPVSGGQSGAENGTLTIMCGGNQADFAQAQTLFQCYAKQTCLVGESGAGQLTKMVNQLCIAGILQGLSEGLHFALRAGLDYRKVIEALAGGAAQSWQMDNRAETMCQGQFDFGFAIDWMRKDLGFCLQEAERNGAHLELAKRVDAFYAQLQGLGYGGKDTSCLIARLEKPAEERAPSH